jgi:glutathione synthase/RimK-type ligase-like ATP-grasp enzyme
VRVLKLISTSGGNLRTEGLLSDCVFQTHLVATEFYDASTVLPPHQLIVNAIGDADVAGVALDVACRLLERTTAPMINAPAAVAMTSRIAIASRLAGLPGVVSPKIVRWSRESLASAKSADQLIGEGFRFPLLLRSPGFHGGEHFLKVEAPGGLAAAVAELPGRDLYVIEFLNARSGDGKIRKYRAMMIDGEIYPLHAAIADHGQWNIHYFSADMEERAEHRAEDAAFLSDMQRALGLGALAALRAIQKTLGLDYGGIDFGLNETGDVLVFEANATMAIFPPDEDPRWDYRRPGVERVMRAVRKMLIDRASSRAKVQLV